MTEQWPICEGCGRRHPTSDDIYKALLTGSFKEEPPKEFKFTPVEVRLILQACEKLRESHPDLETNIDLFYLKVLVELDKIDLSEHAEIEKAAFILELPEITLAEFALEELVKTDIERKEEARELLQSTAQQL